MRLGYLLLAFAGVALGVTSTSAGATTLTMENVINRVPGSGDAGPTIRSSPSVWSVNYASKVNSGIEDGLPSSTACAPRRSGRYPEPDPRERVALW